MRSQPGSLVRPLHQTPIRFGQSPLAQHLVQQKARESVDKALDALSRDYGLGVTGKQVFELVLERAEYIRNNPDTFYQTQLQQHEAHSKRIANLPGLIKLFYKVTRPPKPDTVEPVVPYYEVYRHFGELAPDLNGGLGGFPRMGKAQAAYYALDRLEQAGLIETSGVSLPNRITPVNWNGIKMLPLAETVRQDPYYKHLKTFTF